jgi:hypothetical protein
VTRFVSAVALYGPKAEPLRGRLADVQSLITVHLGDGFRPYSLEQIHATLIAFNGVTDPETGALINEYYLEHTGARRAMDFQRAMRILAGQFAQPVRVRIGGYRQDEETAFRSRGQHPYYRTFSTAAGSAFVLIGWPVTPGVSLNRLRRDMNSAGLLHRYHQHDDDIDDDLHLVVGHHYGAPAAAVERAVSAVRGKLAADPIDIEIQLSDIKIVAADSRTMAPPLLAEGIPVDDATLLGIIAGSR